MAPGFVPVLPSLSIGFIPENVLSLSFETTRPDGQHNEHLTHDLSKERSSSIVFGTIESTKLGFDASKDKTSIIGCVNNYIDSIHSNSMTHAANHVTDYLSTVGLVSTCLSILVVKPVQTTVIVSDVPIVNPRTLHRRRSSRSTRASLAESDDSTVKLSPHLTQVLIDLNRQANVKPLNTALYLDLFTQLFQGLSAEQIRPVFV